MSQTDQNSTPRTLLGLTPPVPGSTGIASQGSQPAGAAGAARPQYQVVSSGWDSEDTGSSGRSDLGTAIGAGVGLVAILLLIGLLLF
jgi:hypothetical protein